MTQNFSKNPNYPNEYNRLEEELRSVSSNTSYTLVSNLIADILRKYIILGILKDGERVVEEQIASMAGVSRVPVREAVLLLSTEGLIVNIPRRGAQIVGVTNEDINEIFRIRTKIEELACEYIIENASEETLNEGKKILDETAISIEIAEKLSTNWRGKYNFNQWIGIASGSKRLNKLHEQYNGYITTFRSINSSRPSRRKQALAEHIEIWNALVVRDKELAIKKVNEHSKNSLHALVINLKENDKK